ncbi:hypothetical protein THF1D04_20302 [Vibrio owensii]|uniref:CopG-like ribbon-helix-helix domain-containing protein n=1 Tax=Vibrio owensii TaxID=696485 RepID=A0AAU9Q3W0_9VIBR|nr:hypothetical protein THF1D04_20302 [Vibrio owensii]
MKHDQHGYEERIRIYIPASLIEELKLVTGRNATAAVMHAVHRIIEHGDAKIENPNTK